MGGLFALSQLQKIVGIGLVALLALSIAWGVRVDGLRAGHLEDLGQIEATVEQRVDRPEYEDIRKSQIVQVIGIIADDRDQFKEDLDEANTAISTQNSRIQDWREEADRLRALGNERARRLATLIEERERLIEDAEAAASRTERLPVEEELRQCEEQIDALYEAGF